MRGFLHFGRESLFVLELSTNDGLGQFVEFYRSGNIYWQQTLVYDDLVWVGKSRKRSGYPGLGPI
jgi:hypothetical protein